MKYSDEKEKGSVQIVEFTYVFPVVIFTVLTLIAFIVIFSLYISSFYITEYAVEEAVASVGTDGRLYWEISNKCIPDDKYKEVEKRFKKHINKLSLIPGVSFKGEMKEERLGRRITAVCNLKIKSKNIFSVQAACKVIEPFEFARNVDLIQELEPEEGFGKVLEEKFGYVLERDKAYEVF